MSELINKELLHQVAAVARLFDAATQRVAEAEAALKREKAALQKIEREDLPELLREVGLEELKLEDGTVVSVKNEFDCGLSEERKPAALQWLRDKGYGGIIKHHVGVSFGKDQVAIADKLWMALQ